MFVFKDTIKYIKQQKLNGEFDITFWITYFKNNINILSVYFQ